jgi:hypothetical protein
MLGMQCAFKQSKMFPKINVFKFYFMIITLFLLFSYNIIFSSNIYFIDLFELFYGKAIYTIGEVHYNCYIFRNICSKNISINVYSISI